MGERILYINISAHSMLELDLIRNLVNIYGLNAILTKMDIEIRGNRESMLKLQKELTELKHTFEVLIKEIETTLTFG